MKRVGMREVHLAELSYCCKILFGGVLGSYGGFFLVEIMSIAFKMNVKEGGKEGRKNKFRTLW